jgi:hypothetical protein
MQKPGDEHLLLLPPGSAGALTPGTYYLGVISEGMNVDAAQNRIGTNVSAFSVWSDGAPPPTDLGAAGAADLLGQVSLQAGECRTWQFTLPSAILALQVSFEGFSGNPMMSLATSLQPPTAPSLYGSEGGVSSRWISSNVVTIPNPSPTNFSITTQATGSGETYPNSAFGLRVRSLPIGILSFTPS